MHWSRVPKILLQTICSSLILLTCITPIPPSHAGSDPDDLGRYRKKPRSQSPDTDIWESILAGIEQESSKMELEPTYPVTEKATARQPLPANAEEQPNKKKAHNYNCKWRLVTPLDSPETDPSIANGINPHTKGLFTLSKDLFGLIASYPGVAHALGNRVCKRLQTFFCIYAERYGIFCRLKSMEDLHRFLADRGSKQVISNSEYLTWSRWRRPVIFTLRMPGGWFPKNVLQTLREIPYLWEINIQIVSNSTYMPDYEEKKSTDPKLSDLPDYASMKLNRTGVKPACVRLAPHLRGFPCLRSLLLWTEGQFHEDKCFIDSFGRPDILSNLTKLEHLRIIQKTHPFSIYSGLTKLKTLHLVGILQFDGYDDKMKPMRHYWSPVALPVSRLTELVLHFQIDSGNARIKLDLNFLSSASALEKLTILNRGVKDMKALAKLRKLRELNLNAYDGKHHVRKDQLDISPLENLPLTSIKFAHLLLFSFDPILTLEKLNKLDVDKWALRVPDLRSYELSLDKLDCIGRLSTLETLSIFRGRIAKDRLFSTIRNLPQLRCLEWGESFRGFSSHITGLRKLTVETHPLMRILRLRRDQNTHPIPPITSRYSSGK